MRDVLAFSCGLFAVCLSRVREATALERERELAALVADRILRISSTTARDRTGLEVDGTERYVRNKHAWWLSSFLSATHTESADLNS